MDPETGLDAVRNVGVRDGKIVRVSAEALSGRRVIHAGGLVVIAVMAMLHPQSAAHAPEIWATFLVDSAVPTA